MVFDGNFSWAKASPPIIMAQQRATKIAVKNPLAFFLISFYLLWSYFEISLSVVQSRSLFSQLLR
jgi:hypothetical protein